MPSLKVPSADSGMLWPEAMEKTAGVTVIEVRVGALTVTPAVPEMEFKAAVMVIFPALSAVSKPEALTAATVGSELCQAT